MTVKKLILIHKYMKKRTFIILSFLALAGAIKAQDVITLKNGDDINAKVLEIGDNEIKYKKFANLNGPTYAIKKSEIFMIKYENGTKDVFTDLSKPVPVTTNNAPVTTNSVPVATNTQDAKATIRGIVKSPNGEPLIGADVYIKGTNISTVTDAKGAFTLRTTKPDDLLVVRFIGYETQEFRVGSNSNAEFLIVLDKVSEPYKFRMYVGPGFGNSYGGALCAGGSVEARFNKIGVHAGVGNWMKVNTLGWNAGLKWYFWKNMYANISYGVIDVAYLETYTGQIIKTEPINGLSSMLGYQWSWGGIVRFGLNTGLGFAIDVHDRFGFGGNTHITLCVDLGISISFGGR